MLITSNPKRLAKHAGNIVNIYLHSVACSLLAEHLHFIYLVISSFGLHSCPLSSTCKLRLTAQTSILCNVFMCYAQSHIPVGMRLSMCHSQVISWYFVNIVS